MGKGILLGVIILAGLFTVLVINSNSTKPKVVTESEKINYQPQNQENNIMQTNIASSSSEISTPSAQAETTAVIQTSKGRIELTLYAKDAPNTVKNFVKLAKQGFYNNVIFHRVIKGFMIQGGDPTGTGTGGPGYKFADELNPSSPSYQAGYKKGVVAMANSGPNTNGSQFFIMLENYPLPNNYTIFGKVIKGQEVVDEIGNAPTGANDRPTNPIKMESVTTTEL